MVSKRTPLARRMGKKYAERKALVAKPLHTIAEAVELLTKLSTSSFDGAAEAHIRINADTTQADQLVRVIVPLPHGTGKTLKIAAFVTDDLIDDAKKAGAVLAGNEDLIKEISDGKIDFDIAIAQPRMMKDLGKIAKTLGQKGLMPSPKSGTVTDNVVKLIEELKKGRIEIKMDKQGIIHTIFGRISFGSKKLQENLEALMAAIKDAKPNGIKGEYIMSVSICPTMGPGVKVQL